MLLNGLFRLPVNMWHGLDNLSVDCLLLHALYNTLRGGKSNNDCDTFPLTEY